MNAAPPLSKIGRLALGISRTTGLRFASSGPPSPPRRRAPKPKVDLYPKVPGHGERVWIYSHLSTGQVAHTLRNTLKVH